MIEARTALAGESIGPIWSTVVTMPSSSQQVAALGLWVALDNEAQDLTHPDGLVPEGFVNGRSAGVHGLIGAMGGADGLLEGGERSVVHFLRADRRNESSGG